MSIFEYILPHRWHARSRKLIEEERVNVARRTRERIALLFPDTEYGLDRHIATTAQKSYGRSTWLFELILLLFVVIVLESTLFPMAVFV